TAVTSKGSHSPREEHRASHLKKNRAMTTTELIRHRLINQQIAGTQFTRPDQIVSWLVAMQAQEYAMSKWAIGLRLPAIHEQDVEKAFDHGKILRTHLMRPTWHFVTPADIRWLLALTAPQVHAKSAYMYRQTSLDSKVFRKSNDAIAKALEGGHHLTRTELQAVLRDKKIIADGFKLGYLMMNAELEQIICSGKRRGKQFTYALLSERAPKARTLTREESLSELLNRYFQSRSPATIQDFCTWSGLSLKESQSALDSNKKKLVAETIDGKKYWVAASAPSIKSASVSKDLAAFLMPDYDEYGMGYKDRSAIFDQNAHAAAVSRGNPVFNRMIIVDGKIAGTWKAAVERKKLTIQMVPFKPLTKMNVAKVANAVERFKGFIE
ncbi:MAG TPA: winged helix DNA-binding domain-containing protein, partial [Cyclobacteriaceae bacterium]|nr:winged helix DNA-binding domain-containing protein [Cyclobacteriaceae bacterium]